MLSSKATPGFVRLTIKITAGIIFSAFVYPFLTPLQAESPRACPSCYLCQGQPANQDSLKTTARLACISTSTPKKFFLYQSVPKRFKTETEIKFDVAENTYVRMTVSDLLGRLAEVLVDTTLAAGTYKVTWNASSRPNGMYYYRMQTANFKTSKELWVKH